jgi:hypothetical protein
LHEDNGSARVTVGAHWDPDEEGPRMQRRNRAIAVLGCPTVGLLLALTTHAHAASTFVYGMGALSCDLWLQERPANMRTMAQQWFLGFVVGATPTGQLDPLEGMSDVQDAFMWVDRYCAHHPKASIIEAAKAFPLRDH